MTDWFVNTLRSYPEIAIFLSLALGYYFGSFTYKGLGLGAVTATLIAAVIIGQLGITIGSPLKPTFFLMFLFAIGCGALCRIADDLRVIGPGDRCDQPPWFVA